MVRDIYEQTRDIGRLKASLPLIIEEYDFWMRQRPSPTGLNRFLHGMPESEFGWKFRQIAGRIPALAAIDNEDDRRAAVHHHLAEGESGWDYTSRFEHRCVDFDPVCLNSMLFLYETLLGDFLCATGDDDAGPWRERAEKRKRLMNKLCWFEAAGVFTDYDRVNNRRSSVLSAAVFFPLFAGLADQSQAQRTAAAAAARLEQPWGLSATERVDSACPYQWDFPNAWPPLQHIAVQGLRNYGLDDDAARLARKYIEATDKIFAATGNLWEKYNAVTGDVDVASEYPMPPLLGWSAGVYLWAKRR
jgi:alpha,alpha-trehalase